MKYFEVGGHAQYNKTTKEWFMHDLKVMGRSFLITLALSPLLFMLVILSAYVLGGGLGFLSLIVYSYTFLPVTCFIFFGVHVIVTKGYDIGIKRPGSYGMTRNLYSKDKKTGKIYSNKAG